MNTLWVVSAAVLPLAQKAPNPADVKPGWLAFFVFLAMFAAVILLWLSFRKQLKKVDFEEEPDEDPSGTAPEGPNGAAPGSNGATPGPNGATPGPTAG